MRNRQQVPRWYARRARAAEHEHPWPGRVVLRAISQLSPALAVRWARCCPAQVCQPHGSECARSRLRAARAQLSHRRARQLMRMGRGAGPAGSACAHAE